MSTIRITNGKVFDRSTDENGDKYQLVRCGACNKIYRVYRVITYEYQLEKEDDPNPCTWSESGECWGANCACMEEEKGI